MFATLWLSGAVALSLGYEGMSLQECNMLTEQMMKDVEYTYQTAPEVMVDRNGNPVGIEEWEVSCEPELLEGGTPRAPIS